MVTREEKSGVIKSRGGSTNRSHLPSLRYIFVWINWSVWNVNWILMICGTEVVGALMKKNVINCFFYICFIPPKSNNRPLGVPSRHIQTHDVDVTLVNVKHRTTVTVRFRKWPLTLGVTSGESRVCSVTFCKRENFSYHKEFPPLITII